ncbi:GDP-mannose-dependent alpha-mannosyltransferase [Planctomycetes bacterium Poly30]|uniref:GDP-mannose-dependent alpha-mannosyltransferase n=1 Tax=Saltatorellus ferox TaxID=2528018 RepID=A0A518EVS1_9BACT|nr:GDP-mannose-dependent alpha-mannosyltransferase [Planctomycetes bacterium Poly30]
MRVVHLVQDRGIRPNAKKGAAIHVAAMCEAFQGLGAEVVRLHASNAEEARHQLERALVAGPIDVLYERYSLGAFEGASFAFDARVPHVLEVNAPLEDEAVKWRGVDGAALDRAAEQQVFRGAHRVLCVSPLVAEYAKGRGAEASAVWVRPNGVNADLFRPIEGIERERADWFPALERPFLVGFHGRLRPWHGFERIVEACRDALAAGVNLAVLCVGEGDYSEALAGALPAERWRHVPWCDQRELSRWVAGFHVIPFGYDPEGACYFSPLKLREAMAAGVVPVVPDLGDLAETVEHGRAGVIYDPSDPGALTQALMGLARVPRRRSKMAIAAREAALGASWEQIARDVLDSILEWKA